MQPAATFDSPAAFINARAVDVLPESNRRTARRLFSRRGGTSVDPAAPAPETTETAETPATARRLTDLIPAQPAAADSAPTEFASGRDRLLVEIGDVLSRRTPVHALVQFGIDDYQQLAERVGPAATEAALRRAGIILTWVFPGHQVTRIDGGCFAALFPFDDQLSAQAQIDRCLALIASTDLSDDASGIRATASAGIVVLDRPGLTPDGVLVEAELALVESKRGGRSAADSPDGAAPETIGRFRRALKIDGFALQSSGAK